MRRATLIGALCTVCVTACSEDSGPNISGVASLDIIRVDVSPTIDTLFVADTLRVTDKLQMKADVIGRLGTPISGAAVVWASSKPEVAVVDKTGLVVPTGYGSTVISASASSVGKATIVVMPAARSVVITPGSDTIFVEDPIAARDTVKFVAKALDEEGAVITGAAFAWTSSGTATASVNAAGVVLARSLGVTTLTAVSSGRQGTASVRVASMVKTVQVAAPVTTVLAKDTVQLTATALGYDDKPMTGRTFSWTSSNPSIATVDATGRVIFLRAGLATFTAKSAFTTNTITVNALERQFQSIDAGVDVTCGYTNLGRGYCWGNGLFGRLASGADSTCAGEVAGRQPCTLAPKRFAGPALEFTAVSVDSTSGCGITKDKLVYCWGDDSFGQIGNGGKGGGAQPTLATVAQIRFDSIAVGGTHACALSTAKQVYCWGDDRFGQLGDNRFVNSTTPIPVNSPLAFTSVTTGRNHTCGVSNAQVYCWGDNLRGQLGNGTSVGSSSVPVAVAGVTNVAAISAGAYHTCALSAAGSAMCWGANFDGQAGTGSEGDLATSPEVVGAGAFVRISSGASHTCAITAAGSAFCWGGRPEQGGAGSAVATAVPGMVFKSIVAGDNHTCGIASDGETYCWGSNIYGTLGNELQAAFRTTPEKVAAPR